MRPVRFLPISLLLALGACQTTGFRSGTVPLDDRTFMGLWRTYSHCRVSEDAEETRNDARRLNQAVRAMTRREESFNTLPEALRALIEESPSRFAVDPGAMAAACALHAAQAAQTAGRYEDALELLRSVSALSEKSGYAYYAAEAERGLARAARALSAKAGGFQGGAEAPLRQATVHP
ncbi:MAG TPA: hypothetical protein VNK46_10895 [Nitrospiraceae bacterium]|jgi:tetratricopeptide (TPR) repeat protein|nr:hypothetical protein [Nitrospiraceae bacterium]